MINLEVIIKSPPAFSILVDRLELPSAFGIYTLVLSYALSPILFNSSCQVDVPFFKSSV